MSEPTKAENASGIADTRPSTQYRRLLTIQKIACVLNLLAAVVIFMSDGAVMLFGYALMVFAVAMGMFSVSARLLLKRSGGL